MPGQRQARRGNLTLSPRTTNHTRAIMTHCWIYKGNKKEHTYLYVRGEDDFDCVPGALLQSMGKLQLVMSLALHDHRKLAGADIDKVMQDLDAIGYFLQLPPASVITPVA